MKNLIVANWKLNPTTKKEAEDIFEEIKKGVENSKSEIVVCPPFLYIPVLGQLASKVLRVGGQNVYFEEKGAFTGEVSALMLKDAGVEYVIIGHSECRKYLGETDEMINKKIKKALEDGLKVIFCIGETQQQHDAGEKQKVLETQIKKGLADVSSSIFHDLCVAYEPVWAIGTGNNCSVEETKKTISFIRDLIGTNVRILYGGSVKSNNSSAYIKEALANGLLVGGASLNPEEFIKIVKSAE